MSERHYRWSRRFLFAGFVLTWVGIFTGWLLVQMVAVTFAVWGTPAAFPNLAGRVERRAEKVATKMDQRVKLGLGCVSVAVSLALYAAYLTGRL